MKRDWRDYLLVVLAVVAALLAGALLVKQGEALGLTACVASAMIGAIVANLPRKSEKH